MGELHELNWEDGFEPIPFEEPLAHPGEVTAAEEACASARVARLAELVAAQLLQREDVVRLRAQRQLEHSAIGVSNAAQR